MDDNELIADFMDIAHPKEHYGRHRFNICGGFVPASSLKYHESWDWLMPVVQKIDQCYSLVGGLTNDYIREYEKVEGMLTNEYDITQTYRAVVDFIKWHNSQNKLL